MNDPELDEAVKRATMALLGKELESEISVSDPDERSRRQRAAATEICRRAGILEVLRAVSADGELSPPPIWPLCDIVPVGGNACALHVEVRTMTAHGKRSVGVAIPASRDKRITKDDIGMAYERGRWELQRLVGR